MVREGEQEEQEGERGEKKVWVFTRILSFYRRRGWTNATKPLIFQQLASYPPHPRTHSSSTHVSEYGPVPEPSAKSWRTRNPSHTICFLCFGTFRATFRNMKQRPNFFQMNKLNPQTVKPLECQIQNLGYTFSIIGYYIIPFCKKHFRFFLYLCPYRPLIILFISLLLHTSIV